MAAAIATEAAIGIAMITGFGRVRFEAVEYDVDGNTAGGRERVVGPLGEGADAAGVLFAGL